MEHHDPNCIFCFRDDELIEMDSNSVQIGSEIIDFSDLINDVMQGLKVETGHICVDCKNQLIQFYCFKTCAKEQINSTNWNIRNQIVRKLDMFLEDVCLEDIGVLRFNQCLIIVPQCRRALVENFQNWQPRVDLLTMTKKDLLQEQAIEVISADEVAKVAVKEEYLEEALDDDFTFEDINNDHSFEVTKPKKDFKRRRTLISDDLIKDWNCSECNKAFCKQRSLQLHMLEKHFNMTEKKTLSRKQKEWVREESRINRKIIKTDSGAEYEWICKKCEFTCGLSKDFRAHVIENHLNEMTFEESDQKITINRIQREWIEHQIKHQEFQESVNSKVKTYMCLKCGSQRRSVATFRKHLVKHLMEMRDKDFYDIEQVKKKTKLSSNIMICLKCCMQFCQVKSFDSHMKMHEAVEAIIIHIKLFKCNICNFVFRSDEDMRIHLNGHSNNESVIVLAEGCALQKASWFRKISPDHEESLFGASCGHCERKFNCDNDFKSHMLIHHQTPITCPIDNRDFDVAFPFINHVNRAHPELMPNATLNCTHCNQPFPNMFDRLAHMKNCQAKRFICDCHGKRFSRKYEMLTHIKQAMGLLKYSCEVCGKCVKSYSELETHSRTHTKLKPFACTFEGCKKAYTTTSARASHMESHRNLSIQCEMCPTVFCARRHYMRHFKRFHDEDYRQKRLQELTCKFCNRSFIRRDRLTQHVQLGKCPSMD